MDPHYVTLDGNFYSFMGEGKFVVMRINSSDGTQPIFELQAVNTLIESEDINPATAQTHIAFGIPATMDTFEVAAYT